MKLGLIAVTDQGAARAAQLAKYWGESCELYVHENHDNYGGKSFSSLAELTGQLFPRCSGLVFFMATGIVVRVLAPHLRDKKQDPAVVVVDEQGRHAISLLSGHLGGGNDLTCQVARFLGAQAVITTATDVQGKLAPDAIASRLGWKIEPFERLKQMNASLVAGEEIPLFLDQELPDWERWQKQLEAMQLKVRPLYDWLRTGYDSSVLITDRLLTVGNKDLFLRPPTLVAGIGCRRGTSAEAIFAALENSCRNQRRSMQSLAALASVDIKQGEPGLLAVAAKLGIPIFFYTTQELQAVIDMRGLKTSEFVSSQIGVGNVCEPAALKAGGSKTLLLPKRKYAQITIALAAKLP